MSGDDVAGVYGASLLFLGARCLRVFTGSHTEKRAAPRF